MDGWASLDNDTTILDFGEHHWGEWPDTPTTSAGPRYWTDSDVHQADTVLRLCTGLLILFGYVWSKFPISGGASIGAKPSFTWAYIKDVLRHAFLPAMSMAVLGAASWFQTSKLIVQNVNAEDYVQYAQLGGVKENKIIFRYVIRNAMLPQVTNLALSLGQILSGALITEIVFSYPGIGHLLFSAISTGDYNLIMGIISLSIVAITTLVTAC